MNVNSQKPQAQAIRDALILASVAPCCKSCGDSIAAHNAEIQVRKSPRGLASFHLLPTCKLCRRAIQAIQKRVKRKAGQK